MNRNLCKTVLSREGSIIPLIIDPKDSKGLGLMNPSILMDKTKILLNLRNINYTLYHCEGEQLFNNRWGPLSYLHPEHDMHLRTYNFMCELDPESLEIKNYCLTDTSTLDKDPLWDFVGLEDARLVRWDGKLYQCGVRRDTTPNGVGRMELSEIVERDPKEVEEGKCKWKEVSRTRIEPPGPHTYCEKNWMPVLDLPFHFVKWTNPTQVVKVNMHTKQSENIYLGKSTLPGYNDFRGGSQVIKWRDYRIALLHEVKLFNNKLEQKDATYTHRFIIWDKDWNIVKISDDFSLMDGEIEFACGLAFYKGDMLVTFGFQDNAAYILRIPEKMIEEILGFKRNTIDWGILDKKKEKKNQIINENELYQKYFKVEKNDVVLDIGANVGSFINSISKSSPKRMFCFEPDKKLFSTLSKNFKHKLNVFPINRDFILEDFLKSYNVDKIDFLKIDHTSFTYDIFNYETVKWIKSNVKKIVIKWDLNIIRFLKYLDEFNLTFEINDLQGNDIKEKFQDDNFVNKNFTAIVYIDNTKKEIEEPTIKLAVKKNYEKKVNSDSQDLNVKWKSSKWPTLEITTNILENGCPVDCVFCPQKVLINAYKGERMLSLDNFKKAIDKIPKDITIIFSGFSEPWINKSTTDMVLYAYKKGHQIAIFTTGIGMNKDDIDKLKQIKYPLGPKEPIIGNNNLPMLNGGFTLHLPDKEGYSKHKITEKYIDLLKYIYENRVNIDGFRIVCMGEVHDKVKDIFPVARKLDLWSRAGNLMKEEKLKPELAKLSNKYFKAEIVKEESTCNCDEGLYHNVLLPNGDVVLCCMDYNLDHILGNLFTQEYNDIIPVEDTPFELCKYCENKKILKK
jgi:organic radical activating enzyme